MEQRVSSINPDVAVKSPMEQQHFEHMTGYLLPFRDNNENKGNNAKQPK
ncbi:MAG: hypothetical protein M3162_05470 [Thermoproteota archaeon]|nr:hypothetical protein [Thermoproteota archaeon]